MLTKSNKQLTEETPAKPVGETTPDEPVVSPAAIRPVRVPREAPDKPLTIDGKGLDLDRTDMVSVSKPSFGIALGYLVGIAAAELVVVLVNPLVGIVLHILLSRIGLLIITREKSTRLSRYCFETI